MSLEEIFGLSQESLLEQGKPDEVMAKKRQAHAEKVRPERLKAARGNSRWTEIENDLVPRLGGRWLVSASSDRDLQPVRGTVFLPDSVNVGGRSDPARVLRRPRRRAALPRAAPRHVTRSTSRSRRLRSFARPLRSQGECRPNERCASVKKYIYSARLCSDREACPHPVRGWQPAGAAHVRRQVIRDRAHIEDEVRNLGQPRPRPTNRQGRDALHVPRGLVGSDFMLDRDAPDDIEFEVGQPVSVGIQQLEDRQRERSSAKSASFGMEPSRAPRSRVASRSSRSP